MTENVAVAENTNADTAAVEKRTDGTDLDALLAEFDQGTQKETVKSPPELKSATISNDEIAAIKQQAQEIQNERFRKEISKTIEDVRGDVPADVFDDDMVEGWLNALAAKQPHLAAAFSQKGQKPKEWDKVKSSLRDMLSDRVKKLRDRLQASEDQADRFAVAQAVRGASTKITAEPPPDFSRMSNAEFERWKMENLK